MSIVSVKASRLTLNTLIARAHQFATQMIGVSLSIGNLLAIGVSATSIIAGTVTFAIEQFPSGWGIPLWIVSGVIGAGLALLIENMTLGALIRIRLTNASIREIEENLFSERDQEVAKQKMPAADNSDYKLLMKRYREVCRDIERAYKRRMKRSTLSFRRSRRASIPLAVVGAFASAVAGGLFYHSVFSGLGQIQSIGVSALFPFVVTCTFISSELFRDVQEAAIREGFGGGALNESALREESRRLLVQTVHGVLLQRISDPQTQQDLKQDIDNMMRDVMADVRHDLRAEKTMTQPSGNIQTPPQETVEATMQATFEETVEATSQETFQETFEETPEETFELPERDTDELPKVANKRITRKLKIVSEPVSGDAAGRVRKAWKRNPHAQVTEIAKKANVSKGYASRIIKQLAEVTV